ncbi:MAG: phage-shock protein [Flavonifractor sp.]|nr:phage-shock protein [Flavonifractor sp.]
MVTLFTLTVICVVAVILIPIVLTIIGLPLMLLLGLLPWLLRVAGVVLLLKAIFQQPVKWENFLPAVGAFVLAVGLGWIF